MLKYIGAAALGAAMLILPASPTLASEAPDDAVIGIMPVIRDTVPPGTPAAFGAAFGDSHGNDAMRTVNGEEYLFVPLTFIPLPDGGRVLVSTGAGTCAEDLCAGTNAVHYLYPGKGDALYDVRGEWMALGAAGNFGNPASRWGWTDRIAATAPVLYTEGESVSEDYRCAHASLIELTPEGPVEIATIPVHYSNAGKGTAYSVTLSGTISAAEKGSSFTVRYTGSESFDELYVRGADGRYAPERESRMPDC